MAKLNQIEVNGTTYDLQDKSIFTGTKSEVNSAISNGTIKEGDIVNITDDAGENLGSGGSSNIIYLTQEAYDALPASKETDGVEYRITDANTSTTVARNIAYDNSESGIEAVSVQDAIDTMNESLTANNSDGSFVDLSSYKSESNRYTFPSDGYLVLSFEGLKATYMRVSVFSANGNIIAQLWSAGLTDYNAYSYDIKSLFVKKGMSVYVSHNTGGTNKIRFYPIS